MKKLFTPIIILIFFLSGCAGVKRSEQVKAQFHTYSTETPAEADKLLFEKESDGSHLIHTVLANDLPIGTATQLALNNKVNNTGNETITGIKTFSLFPISPSSEPTTNYQLANKKYVDDNIGGDQLVDGVCTSPLLINGLANVDNIWPGSDNDIIFSIPAATDNNDGYMTSAQVTSLEGKIDLSNTVDYTSNPISTWGNRTDYAECDSIYQAINDSTIAFDSLPSTTEIVSGDELLLQKNDGTTSKIDALVFKLLINEDLFGIDTLIVRPEDDLLNIILNNSAPHTFVLTPGVHDLDITAHTTFIDLSGYSFIGYGKDQTHLNIITSEYISRVFKINGVCYFKDLSISMSSTDVLDVCHFLNDTADAYLYFLNCDIKNLRGDYEPPAIFKQDDVTKAFNLYIKDCTFFSDRAGHLFQLTISQKKIYAVNSSIGGTFTFDNTTNNILKADNCIFTQEIQFLNLDKNTIEYWLSDIIFRVKPVTSGMGSLSYLISRGNTNYVLPTTVAGNGANTYLQWAIGAYYPSIKNQHVPFEFWNLSKTQSVIYKHQFRSQPLFSFDLNITGGATADVVMNNIKFPFDMRFYLPAGSDSINIATGHDGSDWAYTLLSPETLYDIKTVPCSTAFPVFPSSESDTKIQRQVIAW